MREKSLEELGSSATFGILLELTSNGFLVLSGDAGVVLYVSPAVSRLFATEALVGCV